MMASTGARKGYDKGPRDVKAIDVSHRLDFFSLISHSLTISIRFLFELFTTQKMTASAVAGGKERSRNPKSALNPHDF